jgi:hypothetical protein
MENNVNVVLKFVSNYFNSFMDIQTLFISVSVFFILFIYLKRFHTIFTELVWIYSALLPALIILFLNHNDRVIYLVYYIILNIVFLRLYFTHILSNYFKLVKVSKSPKSKIKEIINDDFGKSKSLEYVGLFILPFITVNNSISPSTIFFILLIVVLILKRFDLFYLNLPILYVFKIQVVLTNKNVKVTVLTRKNFNFQLQEEYDIRSFIKSLKLYIYLGK